MSQSEMRKKVSVISRKFSTCFKLSNNDILLFLFMPFLASPSFPFPTFIRIWWKLKSSQVIIKIGYGFRCAACCVLYVCVFVYLCIREWKWMSVERNWKVPSNVLFSWETWVINLKLSFPLCSLCVHSSVKKRREMKI